MTVVDVWGTTLVDTTSGTSHTPNPATPTAGNIDCGVILISALAVANGTTAITITAPANWTLVQTSSEPGGAGSLSTATAIAFRDNRTSTVTPPAFTTNVATVADIYMVLATTSGPSWSDVPSGSVGSGSLVEAFTASDAPRGVAGVSGSLVEVFTSSDSPLVVYSGLVFTSTLGDHAAVPGRVMLGSRSAVVTVRWTGPFAGVAAFGKRSFLANDLAGVSYQQAVGLANSDPAWWVQP